MCWYECGRAIEDLFLVVVTYPWLPPLCAQVPVCSDSPSFSSAWCLVHSWSTDPSLLGAGRVTEFVNEFIPEIERRPGTVL